LHEGRPPAQHTQDGEGATDESRQRPISHRIQVVDEVTLRGPGVGAQWLVEVGKTDSFALLTRSGIAVGAHALTIRPTLAGEGTW
jgi:hypothetical protein